MNVQTQTPARAANVVALPTRREPRERDFGTGYGRSSGYAGARSYVNDSALRRFRCA